MTSSEIPRGPTSEPITTADALVQALQNNFRGTTLEFIDNRQAVGKDPNLFTFAAMSERVNGLSVPASYRAENLTLTTGKGKSFQFGSHYKTEIQQVMQEGNEEPLAERIRYKKKFSFKEIGNSNILRPYETLVLRGIDQFVQPSPICIELTQYTNNSEKVDVYKFVNRRGDITNSVIMVGCPHLDLVVQKRLALSLKIPT